MEVMSHVRLGRLFGEDHETYCAIDERQEVRDIIWSARVLHRYRQIHGAMGRGGERANDNVRKHALTT